MLPLFSNFSLIKKVKEFDLLKSKTEARDNALHLDCCFQPIGKDKGIIYKGGFRSEADYQYLVDLFGKENLFHIEREENVQYVQ